jgi:hypothetical protein
MKLLVADFSDVHSRKYDKISSGNSSGFNGSTHDALIGMKRFKKFRAAAITFIVHSLLGNYNGQCLDEKSEDND